MCKQLICGPVATFESLTNYVSRDVAEVSQRTDVGEYGWNVVQHLLASGMCDAVRSHAR